MLKIVLLAYSRGLISSRAIERACAQNVQFMALSGEALYSRRIATAEPVFGNLRHNKRLSRFTLRGQHKVSTQWSLYCLVHNIEKLAHHGYR
jgi:transposase